MRTPIVNDFERRQRTTVEHEMKSGARLEEENQMVLSLTHALVQRGFTIQLKEGREVVGCGAHRLVGFLERVVGRSAAVKLRLLAQLSEASAKEV